MRTEELKVLRLDAGLTQAEAARAVGITPNAYTAYERGTKPVPDTVALVASRKLGNCDADAGARAELMLSLGEAVLLLDAGQRDELMRNVKRETVLTAVAEVTLARCRGSIVEAIGERDMRIRQLEEQG